MGNFKNVSAVSRVWKNNEFESEEQLDQFLRYIANQTVQTVSEAAFRLVEDGIKEGIYNNEESPFYDRTYEFLNALTNTWEGTSMDDIIKVVTIDPDLMSAHKASSPRKLNSRMNKAGEVMLPNGSTISEALAAWIEEGSSMSDVPGKPRAVMMFHTAVDVLDEGSFEMWVEHAFSMMGVDIEVLAKGSHEEKD